MDERTTSHVIVGCFMMTIVAAVGYYRLTQRSKDKTSKLKRPLAGWLFLVIVPVAVYPALLLEFVRPGGYDDGRFAIEWLARSENGQPWARYIAVDNLFHAAQLLASCVAMALVLERKRGATAALNAYYRIIPTHLLSMVLMWPGASDAKLQGHLGAAAVSALVAAVVSVYLKRSTRVQATFVR